MRFLIVSNEPERCPYLPEETSRLPLRLPLAPVGRGSFDRLLEQGDRRAGPFLYRTACRSCASCETLRIPVDRFVPTASHRKVLRRNRDLRLEVGEPQSTARHLELFNRHKLERGLSEAPSDEQDYRFQFIESCVDTREVRYFAGDRLVAVSLLDIGERAVSSVYHYFDPDESRRSLGVFSVLAELDWCRGRAIDWYYLGYYVAGCRSLRYKADYHPHQRLIDGSWREFEGECTSSST